MNWGEKLLVAVFFIALIAWGVVDIGIKSTESKNAADMRGCP